jgi:DNA invertase Pin-like site-specific DNA recombinase
MRDNIRIALLEAVIRKRKCRLVSAAGEGTDTIDPNDPSAFLQKSIVDLFATYELQLIRVRTRLALRSKQRRGERTGRLPYGFDVDPGDPRRSRPSNDRHGQPAGNKPIVLVQNPAELDILARMMKLRARGWTFDRITWALGRHGILTKNGKPWGRSSVRHVLIAIEADPCHPVHEILRSSQAVSPSPTSSES